MRGFGRSGFLGGIPLSCYAPLPCVVILGSHVLVRGSHSTNHNPSFFLIGIFITWIRLPSASEEGSDVEDWG